MSYEVVVTRQAKQEVWRNAKWWAEHRSSEQSGRWIRCFEDAVNSLAVMPSAHGYSAENEDFPYPLRDLLFGLSGKRTHRAVFTIANERVAVLTVRHVSQDRLIPADIEPLC